MPKSHITKIALSFDDGEIHSCAYEETESYQITRLFLENREIMLKRLLSEQMPEEEESS